MLVKIPALLSLSVLNVIRVVNLPSLSRVAFNFVIMYFNYSYLLLIDTSVLLENIPLVKFIKTT